MRPTCRSAMPAVGLVTLLVAGAVAGLVRTSLRPVPTSGWSLDAWQHVLADPRFLDAVWFTLTLAMVATTASLVIAVVIAREVRGHRLAGAVLGLPVVVPHLLVAVVAVLWLGPGGLADRVLDPLPIQVIRAPSGLGIVLVYLVKEVPFLVLLLLAAWGPGVDDLAEEAALAGAGPLRTLVQVVVPALRTPLVVGSVLVATFVIGSFEVPLLTGPSSPPTLAVHALDATRLAGTFGRAEAAAVLLVATLAALVVAALVPAVGRRRA